MEFNSVLSLIILLFICRYAHCNYGPGETYPPSIEMEVGQSANISCTMNPRSFRHNTVYDLYFIDVNTSRRVPEKDIKIINNTTIVYMIRNATEHQTSYRCQCENSAIMDTKVYVGYKPLAIKDFKCRSYDYVSMQCNFTKPYNPVLTQYKLSIYFGLQYKNFANCDYERPPLVICVLSNHYRSNVEIYHYELNATNALGSRIQNFEINNTKVMTLAKPGQEFRIEEMTTNSAKFSFRIKNYESYRSKRLQWEVILQPQNFSEIHLSQTVGQIPIPRLQKKFELRLQDLEYAYYSYQIKLRVRLQATDAWSDQFVYEFRTESRIPDRPPRTDVGSFYTILSTPIRIVLYWELLQPHEKNGDLFTYFIEQVQPNGQIVPLNPLQMENNSAVFAWENNREYEFQIRSQNEEGLSRNGSRIRVPAMRPSSKNYTPPAVHNIYHETNGSYTLTWEAPEVSNDLLDYTVFWCRSKRALLNGCEGSIHFTHVSIKDRKFTTSPQEHTLNLAVSANYIGFNTGMHWTECTMSEESDLVKMEPEVEATSPNTIKIQWGWEKVCPSIFDNYNLTYCELAEPDQFGNVSDDCIDNGKSEKIDKHVNRFEIRNLTPYTRYKVEMFMYSLRKVGKKSDPEILRTLESSSSPPHEINISNVTNTTADISWMPPKKRNGILRSYTLMVNDKEIEVPIPTINGPSEAIKYKLENLTSSTLYNVSVLAKTIAPSELSEITSFLTLVGYPSMPGVVSSHDSDNNVIIEWVVPPGRVDYYEVDVTVKQNVTVLKRRISFVKGANSCVLDIPKCSHNDHVTIVAVRAVNAALLSDDIADEEDIQTTSIFDEDENFYENEDELKCVGHLRIYDKLIDSYRNKSIYRLYKSDWHRGPMYSCSTGAVGMIALYIASAMILLLTFFVLLYLMRKKYNKMANIKCTLPPGLDAYMKKDLSGATDVFPSEFLSPIKNELRNTQSESFTPNGIIFTQRNTPDYTTHNEEHCLLESTSHDSIFNMVGDQIHSGNFDQQHCEKTVIELDDTDLGQKIDMDHANEIKEVNTVTESISSPYVQANNGMFTAPMNNGYIKPIAPTQWQGMNSTQSIQPNGYVAVDSFAANNTAPSHINMNKPRSHLKTVDDNGYVQPDTLNSTNPTNTNNNLAATVPQKNPIPQTIAAPEGYTTLDQLSKMPALRASTANWESRMDENLSDNLTADTPPNICGYVTPRELTVFGQQHQQQQNTIN